MSAKKTKPAKAQPPITDPDAARRFLHMLDPEAESFTFQTFDDTPAKRGELARIRHGDLDDMIDFLEAQQRRGAGAFVTINETDGKGRQAQNIKRVRALAVDLDGAPLAPVLEAALAPQIVVESSLGKYHAYWLCGDCSLDQFERMQKAMARKFGGDPSVHDLPRVLRLPGYQHLKGDPFTSRLLDDLCTNAPPYALAKIVSDLQLDLAAPKEKPRAKSNGEGGKIETGGRHEHLFALGRTLRRRAASREAVHAALAAENQACCTPPVSDADIDTLTGRAFSAKDAQGWEVAAPPEAGDATNVTQWGIGADFTTPPNAAKAIMSARFTAPNGFPIIYCWQGQFWFWNGTHYELFPIPDLREGLYRAAPPTVKKRQIDDTLDAMRAFANLSDRTPAHSWLPPPHPTDPTPLTLIPTQNGLLNVRTRALLSPTPRFFALYALSFPYSPRAPAPAKWLDFLDQIYPTDPESIALLQEWSGYCLTANTAQQKALLIIAPKRGGKGTIARVLTELLGRENVCSPTLASFGTLFGLQPLIGKLLALVSDARLGGKADGHAVAENLLRITGEDQISIPRKYLTDHTATLNARIMVLTNEAPRFIDGSGALPSRFLLLSSSESFYGREDPALTSKLLTELPGICNWALEGLDRLLARGHFVQPASGREIMDDIEKLAAPVKAFIADQCDTSNPVAEVAAPALYTAWCRWCAKNGREHWGTQQTFGRDLRSALPRLSVGQHRVHGIPVRYYIGIKLRGGEAR